MNVQTTKQLNRSRWGRLPLTGFAIAILLASGSASAQWLVKDEEARETLKTINQRIGDNGTANGNLHDANGKLDKLLKIGTHGSSGEDVVDPEWAVEKRDITDMTFGVDTRCGNVASSQQAWCQEIVKTENSQYLYMVKMHEITKKRTERLRAIEKEREDLDTNGDDQGKLQDNTNKLLALLSLLQIDQQKMESAMHAYDVRLKYLNQQQMRVAREALTGKSSEGGGGIFGVDLSGLGSALVAGGVMKVALKAAESDKPDGMKRLKFTDGW